MSNVNERLHHTNDAGNTSSSFARERANVHDAPSTSQPDLPAVDVPLVPGPMSTVQETSPGEGQASNNSVGFMAPSEPSSSETASPLVLGHPAEKKPKHHVRPTSTYAFRSTSNPNRFNPSHTSNAPSFSPHLTTGTTTQGRSVSVDVFPLHYPRPTAAKTTHILSTAREATGPVAALQDGALSTSKDIQLIHSATNKLVADHTANVPQSANTIPSQEDKPRAGQDVKARRKANISKKREEIHAVSTFRVTKSGRRPGQQFEMQWRVGQAPKIGLQQSHEQMQYERLVSSITRFYSGNAEADWKSALSVGTAKLDQDFESLRYMGLVVTVAALVTAGRSVQAYETLDKIIPTARNMLLSQHPMSFWLLVDQVMDTSQTVLGNLRAEITKNLASLSSGLLGTSHPFTILLQTRLTDEQKRALRMTSQMIVHKEMARVFGLYAYQTFIQFGYSARTVLEGGDPEGAINMISQVIEVLERQYGLNSAMPTLGMIEQARYEFVSGSSSVMLECLLADALRRNHILLTGSSGREDESLDEGESALRNTGLLFMRIGALRMLGRVHVRRRSFGAAIHHFQQAVAAAQPLLKPGCNTIRMYEADLEMAKLLEIEQSMGVLGAGDPSSRLANPMSITQWVPAEDRM